jgi:hypothetical protein
MLLCIVCWWRAVGGERQWTPTQQGEGRGLREGNGCRKASTIGKTDKSVLCICYLENAQGRGTGTLLCLDGPKGKSEDPDNDYW